MLSSLSHDLRTPLASILGAATTLLANLGLYDVARTKEMLVTVREEAERLDRFVGNLLDMSRLQVGALVAHSSPVDLQEVVPSTVAALSRPSGVVWQIEPSARRVVTDPGLLDRVLGNVIENALRYQSGGLPVMVNASRVADRVEIRVVDSGPGVPEADLDTIFLPFQRHGDVPAGDGVGLGLAVARGLAEAMDGAVHAEPTPGGGLTVVITLPTAARSEPAVVRQGV